METGLLIKNVIIIGVIVAMAYFSQSAFFRPAVEHAYSQGVKNQSSYLAKIDDWAKTNIYPKLGGVSGEVAQKQDSLQNAITQQKDSLVKNSTDAAKKLLAEKILNFLDVTPQELGSCPAK